MRVQREVGSIKAPSKEVFEIFENHRVLLHHVRTRILLKCILFLNVDFVGSGEARSGFIAMVTSSDSK